MGRYIDDIKNKYISNLAIYGQTDRVKELNEQDKSAPIYKPLIVHEDEEPIVQEHNTMLSEICMDINALNADLSSMAYKYYEFIDNAKSFIQAIKNKINETLEIQNDMNMLSSAFSNCNNFVNISKDKILDIDSDTYTDNIFHAKEVSSASVYLRSANISGNGYAGNGHVYNKSSEKYLSETFDTSKIDSILNTNNIDQYFEYSRIISNSNTVVSCGDVNYDSNNAKCSLYLQSDSVFNVIKIASEQQHLKIIDIYTSLDGASYNVLSDFHNFEFNNKSQKYASDNYIISSGIFNLPDSKYIKITFESNEYDSNEVLAYQNKNTDGSAVKEKTEFINNAFRYKIKINSIQAFRKTYDSQTIIVSDNLMDSENINNINGISLYVSEYCPKLNRNIILSDYIKYGIIINETEYNMVPINRNEVEDKDSIKILKIKNGLTESKDTLYISEDVKSVKIKIVINCIDKYNSPYISDLKLLVSEGIDA